MNKRALIIIICVSVAVRIATAFWMGDQINYLPAIFDQYTYDTLASRVLSGHGFTFDKFWWPVTRAGEPTAHWSYLYTLYLSFVYQIFGLHPLPARLIQAILAGILMPWLTYRLARRVFPPEKVSQSQSEYKTEKLLWVNFPNRFFSSIDELIPLLAAAWVALYSYFIYFAAALMTETFYIISILWALDCTMRIAANFSTEKHNYLRWVELGLAMATVVLLRQVFLLFIPFLMTWIVWSQLRGARKLPGYVGFSGSKRILRKFLLGGLISSLILILFIAPFTVFNYQQFHRLVLLNTNAGYAFFLSNHPSYGIQYEPLLSTLQFRKMIPTDLRSLDEAALDQELLKRGIGFVLQDPTRFLLLSLSKIPAYFLFWPTRESTLSSDIGRLISFGLAVPFMLLGIGFWINDTRKKIWPIEPAILLLLFGGVYTFIHLISWAGIRYRLPVDAVLLIFSAFGLVTVLRIFTRKIYPTANNKK